MKAQDVVPLPHPGTGMRKTAPLLVAFVALALAGAVSSAAIAAQQETGGPELARAAALDAEAARLHEADEHVQAELRLERALAIREKVLGKNHLDVASTLDHLAAVYDAQAKYAEADELYERSLAIREQALGVDHPDVALARNRMDVRHQRLVIKRLEDLADVPPAVMADHYQLLGATSTAVREFEEAADAYGKAIELAREHGPRESLAKLLGELGKCFERAARYEQAIESFREALEGYGSLQDQEGAAQQHARIGRIYLKRLNDAAQAEARFREALRLYEATGRNAEAVEATIDLGLCKQVTGDLEAALELFGQALQGAESQALIESQARGLTELAKTRWLRGEYRAALKLLSRSNDIAADSDLAFQSNVNHQLLGLIYWELNQYERAHRALDIAVKEARRGQWPLEVASACNNRGIVYHRQAKFEKALECFQEALAIDLRLGTRWGQAYDHRNIGMTLRRMGRYDDAADHLERAVRFSGEIGLKVNLARALLALGDVRLDEGAVEAARDSYEEALEILEVELGPDHADVATALHDLATVALDGQDFERAWTHAQRARDILLRARQRAAASALARSSFQAERASQNLLPCLALELGKEADVLELLEMEQALGLRELLAQARAQTASVLPEADRNRVMAALGRINAVNAQIETQARQGLAVGPLRDELQRAELAYESLMAEMSERYEQFVAAETARGITSSEAANSPALDDRTAIAGWMEFGDWSWGYVIRRQGVNWVELSRCSDPSDGDLVRRILSPAADPGSGTPAANDLAELYRRRLAPLEPHLAGVDKLIIIAQDWAAVLPLEMLLTRQPSAQERDMARWPWLGERYEMSYAPSVTTLDLICRGRAARRHKQWARPLFALADPPFSQEQLAQMTSEQAPPAATSPRAQGRTRRGTRADPEEPIHFDPAVTPVRLPGTRSEAQLLAALLGPEKLLLLIGPEATERKLFEANDAGELAKCRYVHLATHGFADSERPELSSLLLARVPPDPDYDGRLQMREVFHLKLDADLVVLSACQTGLGRQLRGEGVVGLSTAFFFAGTPSLVMSLWNVSDVSTALLMQRFYANLLAGQAKSAALREAKSWLRDLSPSEIEKLGGRDLTRALGKVKRVEKGKLVEEKPFAHPHYWAAFVLTGEPS